MLDRKKCLYFEKGALDHVNESDLLVEGWITAQHLTEEGEHILKQPQVLKVIDILSSDKLFWCILKKGDFDSGWKNPSNAEIA